MQDRRRRTPAGPRTALVGALMLALLVVALTGCKRQAGPADQITGDATARQGAQPAEDEADRTDANEGEAAPADSDTYAGAFGRSRSGAAPLASGTVSPATKAFLTSAAQTGALQVQAGKLAEEKAKSLEVKQFADMMVQAHSKVNDSLVQLARTKGLEISPTLTSSEEELLSKLRNLSGTEFDRTYSQEMLKAHQQALRAFEEASQSGADTEVQAFAKEQLPALRDQLRVAQTLPGANRG